MDPVCCCCCCCCCCCLHSAQKSDKEKYAGNEGWYMLSIKVMVLTNIQDTHWMPIVFSIIIIIVEELN